MKIQANLWVGAAALWIGFIFWNSLHTGAASGGMSTAVLAWMHQFPGTDWITEFVVRKAAHFTEFWILGALLSVSCHARACTVQERLCIPLAIALQTAVLDETIQYFVPGRVSAVRDVLIDFAGASLAVVLIAVPLCLLRKRRQSSRWQASPRAQISRGQIVWQCLIAIALIVVLGFVWSNSLLNATLSNEDSYGVWQLMKSFDGMTPIKDILHMLVGGGFTLDNHHVRKLAHFSEYLMLGALLVSLLRSRKRTFKTYWHKLWLFLLLIPVSDEGIQYFSKGRMPLVSDVWIDFAGMVCGVLLASVLHRILQHKTK